MLLSTVGDGCCFAIAIQRYTVDISTVIYTAIR